MPARYDVRETEVAARAVAGVRAQVAAGRVKQEFGKYLDQVYAAGRSGAMALDGQNIFIYRDASNGVITVDFCVGVDAPFTALGSVTPLLTPSGVAATTTHWGDYAELGAAHTAVMEWCRANNRALAGSSWEVYGHWHPEPAQRRTDVYYLLAGA